MPLVSSVYNYVMETLKRILDYLKWGIILAILFALYQFTVNPWGGV